MDLKRNISSLIQIDKITYCMFSGSGIPEVKVIMSGFKMPNYLTFKTLVAKMLGLTLAIGGGLPIGKEVKILH